MGGGRGGRGRRREGFAKRYDSATRDSVVVRFLTVDPESPNSIVSCLRYARDNARTIREAISSETWDQINKWYLLVNDAAAGRRRSSTTRT